MTKKDYARMLAEGFSEIQKHGEPRTRLEYLSEYIFQFITYDGKMSELFASKAIEVCIVISDGKTFDYIKKHDSYQWFLIMCNMPFFAERLTWGASIRGAWWAGQVGKDIEYESCGLWLDGRQIIETLVFTDDQWRGFVSAVVEFGDKP